MSQVNELADKIVKASMRYYSGETLLMSDEQFDLAIDELRKLDPDHWILKTAGWGANDSEAKINHIGKNPVGSLDKRKYPETDSLMNKPGIISPKLDGLTVVCNVYNGEITGLTRNNGLMGKDCTNKLVHLLKTKHPLFYQSLLNIKGMFSVRGEVVTDPDSHEHLRNNVSISLRNIASGIMNRSEITSDLEHLLFVPYFIRFDSENQYVNQKAMLDKLELMGSYPIPHEEFQTIKPDYLQAAYSDWQAGFLIDGVVLLSYDGWTQGPDYTANETNAIAYKFAAEAKEAVVDKVVWNTGSAGRVVPVAVLTAPIELSGANVTNISCHHAKNVADLGIGKGAVVLVSRANEVIPFLNEVIKPAPIDLPDKCPCCDHELKWDGCYLICPSTDCQAQSRNLIIRFFECCNKPDGLSTSTLTKWLDEFPVHGGFSNINTLTDFILLFKQVPNKDTSTRANILKAKFGDHYGELLYKFENNIQAKLSSGLTPSEFWFSLNFKGIGNSSSKKMGHINPHTLDIASIDSSLSNIDGITYLAAESLKVNFDIWKPLSKLFTIVEAKQEVKDSSIYAGLNFCMTGVRHKELSQKLVSNGAKEMGGVGKGCTLLIAKDPNSTSGKASEARSKGIEIISLEEALKRFGL